MEQQCHKFVFHPYLSESRVGQPGGGVGWDCTKSRKNVFTSSTLRAPGKRQTQKQVEWFHCSHIVFLEMSGHVGPCPMIITGATTISTHAEYVFVSWCTCNWSAVEHHSSGRKVTGEKEQRPSLNSGPAF